MLAPLGAGSGSEFDGIGVLFCSCLFVFLCIFVCAPSSCSLFVLQVSEDLSCCAAQCFSPARLAQSAERKALNLAVVGSSPTVGVRLCSAFCHGLTFRICCRSLPACPPRTPHKNAVDGGAQGTWINRAERMNVQISVANTLPHDVGRAEVLVATRHIHAHVFIGGVFGGSRSGWYVRRAVNVS